MATTQTGGQTSRLKRFRWSWEVAGVVVAALTAGLALAQGLRAESTADTALEFARADMAFDLQFAGALAPVSVACRV